MPVEAPAPTAGVSGPGARWAFPLRRARRPRVPAREASHSRIRTMRILSKQAALLALAVLTPAAARSQEVPAGLAPPAGSVELFRLRAEGEQVYECRGKVKKGP